MNVSPSIEYTLSDLRGLVAGTDGLDSEVVTRFLERKDAFFDELLALAVSDDTRPYGRRVLLDSEVLEVMVACWTPGVPCAPHDHGGSVGAVRVLQGRAHHQRWAIADGRIIQTHAESVEAGGVMSCGADIIHSMGDAGGELPLVTLHMYIAGIDHMVVYDTESEETLVVEGSCGAWVPHDQPEMIRRRRAGYHAPDAVR